MTLQLQYLCICYPSEERADRQDGPDQRERDSFAG
jgi:hypothetical protein